MCSYNAVYFKITRYHAGTSWSLEDSSPVIHSDTFVSGLIWSYVELYGRDEAENLIKELINGGLRVSSLYPSRFYGKYMETFPTPLPYVMKMSGVFERLLEERLERGGKVEGAITPKGKVHFVSKKIFEKLINGTLPDVEEMGYHGGLLYFHDEECLRISRVTVYRNVKDRLFGYTTPWRLSYYVLEEGCGLRLLYKVTSKNLSEKKIKATMVLVAENGLGGERSLGLGYSNEPPIFKTIDIGEPAEGSYFTTLSLYYPLESEIRQYAGREVFYELVERGGFTDSRIGGLRVKRVRMFREGSVFPLVESSLGGMVNVGGVYRYGFAFPVRMRWNS